MENKDTQDKNAPAGNGNVPPAPAPNPAPTPAEDVAKLKAEKEELAKKLAEKDQYITQVTTEKATLEARLQGVQPKGDASATSDMQVEVQRILETAQLDPVAASKELAAVLKRTEESAQKKVVDNLSPLIEQNTYIAKVKSDNADLMELGLEPSITLRANQLISGGKQFKDAVDTAVGEAREKVKKMFHSNVPPTPPPAGSVGEGGHNGPPTPPPPVKEETAEDEVKAMREQRRKQGL